MELIKDYKFRKLVAEYLGWIFTTGWDRVAAHEAVCNYLIANWDIYKGVDKNRAVDLKLLMSEFITNDVVDSIKYPTDNEGRYIHNTKNTKVLVDNFCLALEKLKPVIKADLDFWDDKEGGKHVFCTGKYRNLDDYLKEL